MDDDLLLQAVAATAIVSPKDLTMEDAVQILERVAGLRS